MVLSMFAAVTAYAGRPAEPATFRADHFDVAEMIREADQTGDGKLNFEEFKKVSLGWAGCGGLLGGEARGAVAGAPEGPARWRWRHAPRHPGVRAGSVRPVTATVAS